MDLHINKLSNKQFTAMVSLKYLINSVENVYKKDIKEIEDEYSSEKISEEYSEYIISSSTNDNIYIDSLVLFTKEKFENNYTDITIDNFIVADGISKLIIMNNLLITKEFILKRIDLDNIGVFKDLYKSVFTAQTNLPGYYLDAVLASLRSRFNNNIRKFEMEFLMNKIALTIVTNSDENYMREYITNKNIINKLLTSDELSKKIKFKMIPYID